MEDSAHCFEDDLDGVKPGHYSTCAVFSFYATKNVTPRRNRASLAVACKVIEIRPQKANGPMAKSPSARNQPAEFRANTVTSLAISETGLRKNSGLYGLSRRAC